MMLLLVDYIIVVFKKFFIFLKRSRTIADYDKKIIKKSDYKELKENFLEIDEVLNELLNEGWGWKWKTK